MQGLYLLWWIKEKHVSAPTLALILAIGDLMLMALEVPTGWFADKFGHQKSLIAGSAVQVVGMLLCWLGQGVPGLIAASLLVALGDALRSGADQALLYRTCLALDCETAFQSIEGQTHAWQSAALLIQVLAGGFIVQRWGFDAGWIVETVVCGIGFGIACAMTEPPGATERRTDEAYRKDGAALPTLPQTLLSLRFIGLIMPAAFVASGHSATTFLVQTLGGVDAEKMTWLVAAIALAEAVGSAMAIVVRNPGFGVHVVIGLSGALVLVIGVGVRRPLLFVTAIMLSLLDGLALPLRSAAIQRLANDAARARAASFASACDMALKMIALPLAGSWRVRTPFRR